MYIIYVNNTLALAVHKISRHFWEWAYLWAYHQLFVVKQQVPLAQYTPLRRFFLIWKTYGKEFYGLRFVLNEKGYNRGSVIDAYCVCLGARHGGFRNVTALCSLKDLLNSKRGGGGGSHSIPRRKIRRPTPNTTACELKICLFGKEYMKTIR